MAVYTGDGTKLSCAATSVTPLVEVGQLLSLSGPDITVGERDRTHLGSLGVRQYAPGLTDYGSISFQVFMDSANVQHRALEASCDTRSIFDFEIAPMDGSKRTFSGFVTSFSSSGMDVETDVVADVTVRLTTKVTYTAPTPP